MNASKTQAPYGSWKSPIGADAIASSSLRLGQLCYDGDNLYFLEGRPQEGGRQALVVRRIDGQMEDALPSTFNVRTLVHEYGGGAFTVDNGDVFFVNYKDQRVWVKREGKEPEAITGESKMRFADLVVDRLRERLVCVMEDHTDASKEPQNKIVSISFKTNTGAAEPEVLAEGHDFYAYPRLNPDADILSYICWQHPNMPWDGTELHIAKLGADGLTAQDILVAGSKTDSVFQPTWSPDGKLYFVDEPKGWWNLFVIPEPQEAFGGVVNIISVAPMEAEFGLPLWVFGMSTYDFLDNKSIVCTYNLHGNWHLGIIQETAPSKYKLSSITSSYSDFSSIVSNGSKVAMHAGSPSSVGAIVEFDTQSRVFHTIKTSSSMKIDSGYLSAPQVIEFPTDRGNAFAFYYPPANQDFAAPANELPPLLVKSHGGPTGSTSTNLSPGIQYWTSRGFAVVDVNYGGSTGYGREYRKRLDFSWGIVDVNDCANAARYLVKQGLVDGNRLAITGGSAGGYTTLCALTFLDEFKAGASHFGIGDIEALARDTHKFESRYLDYLVGAYPEQKQVYLDRSPINFTDKLNCPVIFFQGLEDAVVPPNQAEAMVNALKKKGLPVAYIAYEGEQHGFRKAENIKRTIEAEFYFYSKIFGYKPADEIEPVTIENLSVGAKH